MKRTLILIAFICSNGLLSCDISSSPNEKSIEIWKSELIRIKSANNDLIDSLKDHHQYLYLYENGRAELVDSLSNGTIGQSSTTWEIRKKDGRDVFWFGYGKESEGIAGVAYPIIIKNETNFKMLFDSSAETHIWNLKRIK